MSQPATRADPVPSIGAESDIPVTVIGGYLGSGKTTLVNHLLAAGTERVAVLVNDFGEVDIDADLIERDDGDTIALANGCICCSLVDGLAAALNTITGLQPRPDRLVIEASGVADPASVAAYGHGPGLSLDATVVLVDAETVRQRAVDRYVGDTVLGQLRAADVVVVNKTDLVDRAEVESLLAWLDERIDRAVVVEATQAAVDPAVLFGTVDRSGRRHVAVDSLHDRADAVFQTWTWVGEGTLTRSAIEIVMGDLPDAIIRAKGIVALAADGEDGGPEGNGVGQPHVLQRVGGRWSLRPVSAGAPAATSTASRMVLIGYPGAVDDRWLADRLRS
ncbi:MAG: CobW family GTP-binding protein [Acidimicrobiales bacterium]